MSMYEIRRQNAIKRITQDRNMNREKDLSREIRLKKAEANIWTPSDRANWENAVTSRGRLGVDHQNNAWNHTRGMDQNNIQWAGEDRADRKLFADTALNTNKHRLDIAKAAQSTIETDPLTGEQVVIPGLPLGDKGGIMLGGFEGPPASEPMLIFRGQGQPGYGQSSGQPMQPDVRGGVSGGYPMQQPDTTGGIFRGLPPQLPTQITSGNVKDARQELNRPGMTVQQNRFATNNIPEGVPLNMYGRPLVESKTVGNTTYITNTRDFGWGGFKDVPGLEPYSMSKQAQPQSGKDKDAGPAHFGNTISKEGKGTSPWPAPATDTKPGTKAKTAAQPKTVAASEAQKQMMSGLGYSEANLRELGYGNAQEQMMSDLGRPQSAKTAAPSKTVTASDAQNQMLRALGRPQSDSQAQASPKSNAQEQMMSALGRPLPASQAQAQQVKAPPYVMNLKNDAQKKQAAEKYLKLLQSQNPDMPADKLRAEMQKFLKKQQ